MSADVVLDASAAVKWVREENGSDLARELVRRHVLGELRLWLPEQCLGELLAVTTRVHSPETAVEVWRRVRRAKIAVAPLSDGLVERAADVSAASGCSFYDALAPALADMLDAPLVSADKRAHAEVHGVWWLG